jgi:peptidase MA superfamily protein
MKIFRNIIIILTIITNLLLAYDFSAYEKENIKYFFPPNDSSFVKTISLKIHPEIEKFENIFNHKLKNKIKIFFPESEEDYTKLTGGRLPEWSGAVAFSENRIIIIKPQQFIDNNKLFITIKHELIHIVIADKYFENNLPLWLNEGLATYLSNNYLEENEGLTLSNAIAAKKILELKEINQLMQLNTASANLAYLEAKIAVEYLIKQIGISQLPDFLDDLNSSKNSNKVFKKYLGYDFVDFEFYWYNYLKDKYEGLFVLNFDNMIWYILILIVVIAFIIVKIRNYKKKKSWEIDELLENLEE